MTKLFASAIFAATFIAAPAVYAVDIENQDGVDHQVTVTIGSSDSAPYPFILKAGEKHMDLCLGENGCTVELGNSDWNGGGDTQLIVKGGKLAVQPKSPRG